MPELFISYSRKDKAYVQRLHDALAAHKRDVWIDWEDIPLASDWRSEVFAGIESSDSFVFVLSPNSAASEVCAEEISHAVTWHKRVIPILFQDGDYKSINEAISSHNWIYSRPDDDFDAAVKSLLETLDTDLDYVKMHTRLLLRAREWDTKQRNPSFVLRGTDLQDAERWHVSSAGKKPPPTQLHHEYIDASRKIASRRQRFTIGALTVGLVIAVVLALFALRQTQIADENASIVEGNYRHIRSQQLGVQAQNLLNREGNRAAELAALLAIQGMKTENSIEAENSLSQALKLIYPSTVLKGHTDIVTSVAITSDEKYVVTGSADKTVRLWEAETGKEIRQFVGHTDKVTGVAILEHSAAYDGPTAIVSSSADGTVRVWDLEKGIEIGQLVGHTGAVTSVHTAEYIIVTTGADKTARIWDGRDLTQYKVLTGHQDVVTSADISLGGRFIVTGSLDKTARLWDVTTGQVIASQDASDAVMSVALRKDYSGIDVGTDERSVQFESVNLLPPDLLPDLTIGGVSSSISAMRGEDKGTSATSTVGLLPDGNSLLYSTGDSNVHDALGNKYNLVGHADSITSIATSNTLIVTGSYDKTARIWHILPGDGIQSWDSALQLSGDGEYALEVHGREFVFGHSDAEMGPENFTAMGFSPDGKSILWSNDSGQFELRTVKTNDLISHFDLAKDAAYNTDFNTLAGLSPDGKQVAFLNGDPSPGQLPPQGIVVDVTASKVLGKFPGHVRQFSPDGKYLITVDDKYHLFKVGTMEDVSSMLPPEALANFEFTPDGSYIAYANGSDPKSSSLVLLDSTTAKEVRRFPLTGSQFAFVPDGKTVLDVGNANSPMRILDVQSGAEVRHFVDPLTFSPTEIRQLNFSADGKYLLTGTGMEINVWDTSTGHRIRQFAVEALLPDARITPDGQSILVHDGFGKTIMIPIDFQDRIKYACTRLSRDLTDTERLQYSINDNTPTCSQNTAAKQP